MEEEVVTTVENAVAAQSALAAVFATMGIFAIVIGIAWYILQVIAYWKIFVKAGKPGWHSIIPFLNNWDEVDLSWSRTMAWVVTCLSIVGCVLSVIISNQQAQGVQISGALNTLSIVVALIAIVLSIISEYKLAKAFGKGIGFFLGLVFLNPIFKLILGFGDAQYQGRQG